jgi:flavin reductase (DIM6/NTAB) family NADH-FMN oxidoreductase RutF
VNAAAIADLFAQLDPPLWLVTAAAGPRRGGLVASFVSPASIVPDLPRVLVGVAKQHYTWQLIEASGAFALLLLGEGQLDWVWRFGLGSGRAADKLAGLDWRPLPTGAPLLTGAPGWLSCRVEGRLDTGDRTAYLAEVLDGELTRPGPPLTLKWMLQLAPAERLRELREGMERDSAVDAAAIRAFRDTASRSV